MTIASLWCLLIFRVPWLRVSLKVILKHLIWFKKSPANYARMSNWANKSTSDGGSPVKYVSIKIRLTNCTKLTDACVIIHPILSLNYIFLSSAELCEPGLPSGLYLNVASSLDSCLQDCSVQMFGILSLRALANLLLQRLSNGAVQLVSCPQLRPKVPQIILQGQHM